jgi:hypothetical protein
MKPKTLQRIHLREATVLLVAARSRKRGSFRARLLPGRRSRPPRRPLRRGRDRRVSWAVGRSRAALDAGARAAARAIAHRSCCGGAAQPALPGFARDGAALTSMPGRGRRAHRHGGDAARRATSLPNSDRAPMSGIAGLLRLWAGR